MPPVDQMTDRAARLDQTLTRCRTSFRNACRISSTPAIAPVKGIPTSGFASAAIRMTHGRGVHQADIAAASGQPVRASAERIKPCGRMTPAGTARPSSSRTASASRPATGTFSRLEVRPGQRVKRGDVIGRVGTGRSTDPTSTTRSDRRRGRQPARLYPRRYRGRPVGTPFRAGRRSGACPNLLLDSGCRHLRVASLHASPRHL